MQDLDDRTRVSDSWIELVSYFLDETTYIAGLAAMTFPRRGATFPSRRTISVSVEALRQTA
jgi:hypothetical protein